MRIAERVVDGMSGWRRMIVAAVLLGLVSGCPTDGGVSASISDEEIGSAQVVFEDANSALVITEEGGIGSVTTKVVEDESGATGGPVKVAEVTVETGDDTFKVSFDEDGKPTKVASSAMVITMTNNEDGTFDYTVSADGQADLTGTNVAGTDKLATMDAASARIREGALVSAVEIPSDLQDEPAFLQACLLRTVDIVIEEIPGVDPIIFTEAFLGFLTTKLFADGIGVRTLEVACVLRAVVLPRLEELASRCAQIDSALNPLAGPRCQIVLAAERAVRDVSHRLDAMLFNIAVHVFDTVRPTLVPPIFGPPTVTVGETGIFTTDLRFLEDAGFLRPDVIDVIQWSLSTAPGGGAVFDGPTDMPAVGVTGTIAGPVLIGVEITVGTLSFEAERGLGIAPVTDQPLLGLP